MRTAIQTALCVVLLFLGGATYLLFRPRTILMFKVVDAIGIGGKVDKWREEMAGVHLPDFMVDCLPNGLWVAAYILLIDGLLHSQAKRVRVIGATVIPLAGVVAEIMQAMGVLPGTFDFMDIACLLVPLLVYVLICK